MLDVGAPPWVPPHRRTGGCTLPVRRAEGHAREWVGHVACTPNRQRRRAPATPGFPECCPCALIFRHLLAIAPAAAALPQETVPPGQDALERYAPGQRSGIPAHASSKDRL